MSWFSPNSFSWFLISLLALLWVYRGSKQFGGELGVKLLLLSGNVYAFNITNIEYTTYDEISEGWSTDRVTARETGFFSLPLAVPNLVLHQLDEF